MDSSKIRISIIFPSYYGEDVIFKNLNSIFNLSNSNEIELVIVDNNSKDTTKEVIKSFKKKIRINLIEQKTNLGYAEACNIAVSKAKGEFIFLTNQDVAFPENFFEILLNIYDKNKINHEIIISPAIVFPGNFINYFGAKIHFLGFSYTSNMYKKIPATKLTFKTLKASGCSIFMKKNVFLQLNGFDPFFFMYHEDSDFSLRAIRNKISIFTTNKIVLHHQKIHMSINNFSYYYIERNRYLVIYKNVNNLKKLIPYFILSEILLIFQAIITKKFILRLKVYKFLLENYKTIKNLRINQINKKTDKLQIQHLNKHLSSIVLGKTISRVKIFRILLRLINLIL